MSTKETLIKARDLLVERGVNRDGELINQRSGCQVCALGAIELALGAEIVQGDPDGTMLYYDVVSPFTDTAELWDSAEYVEYRAKMNAARDQLQEVIQERSGTSWIPEWNDDSLDDAEVIDAFNEAIERAS